MLIGYVCPDGRRAIRYSVSTKTRIKLLSERTSSLKNCFILAQSLFKGLAIRKAPDCLIAHYALAYDLPLLHKHKDFDSIAKVFPIQIIGV